MGNQAIEVWGVSAGGWFDLAWTLPFATVSLAAAEFPACCESQQLALPVETRNIANLLLEYLLPILMPSLVLALVYPVIVKSGQARSLVVLSLVCFVLRMITAQFHRESVLADLSRLVKKNPLLSGMLPICAACKMIRDAEGTWHRIESYIRKSTGANFTHGICPECAVSLYPDYADLIQP